MQRRRPDARPYITPAQRLACDAVLCLAALTVTGCTNRPRAARAPSPNDLPMDQVIARVNRNSAGMDFLLRGGGVVATGEYIEDGKRESFELRGTLLYRKPHLLYLQLQHALGKMEIGSNDQEFWVWKQLGKEHYWWGRYENLRAGEELAIPIRPDQLLQVLGLETLPEEQSEANGPVFWVGPQRYELLFMDRDADARMYLQRTVDIDRTDPGLIRAMVFFDPDGHPKMVATLGEYAKVEGSTVQAPQHIRMDWKEDGSWLDLRFRGALGASPFRRFEQPAAERKFQSPMQRGLHVGHADRVDRPVSAAPPPAAGDER